MLEKRGVQMQLEQCLVRSLHHLINLGLEKQPVELFPRVSRLWDNDVS